MPALLNFSSTSLREIFVNEKLRLTRRLERFANARTLFSYLMTFPRGEVCLDGGSIFRDNDRRWRHGLSDRAVREHSSKSTHVFYF